MPRKKKSNIEVLINIIEDGELTTTDLQWIDRIVTSKLRNREVSAMSRLPDIAVAGLKEAKDASEKRSPAKADGLGPIKSPYWKKDKDRDVDPKPEEVREEKPPKKEKE